MKELEKYSKISTESEVVVPIKTELKLIRTLKPNKGHKCFEINTMTNEICEAEF